MKQYSQSFDENGYEMRNLLEFEGRETERHYRT